MKSQNIRTYKKDGKTFMWNRIGFIDEIDRITKAKDAAGKRIGPTQIALFERIADQCDITPEAIRHWRAGNNSPVKLEYIEVCANVLGIDIMSLLTPIEEKTEAQSDGLREGAIIF